MNNKKILLFILGCLIINTFSSSFAFAKETDIVKITMKADETLRSIAKKYFGEPNDWEVILYYNGYKSPGEVKTGMTISVPVKLYRSITNKLELSHKTINTANKEGASILAKDLVETALKYQKEAISLKKKGELNRAENAALESIKYAKQAIQQTKDKRIKSINAVLTEKHGKVQSRNPSQTVWYNAVKKQELIEKERIRTLSNANGEITFIDGSKLNLSENALAVIEAMKQDLIKNTNTSSVVVLQGDVLAYLSSLSKKNAVNVSTPGVETEIRSRKFRTSRDKDNVARFANYDGEIDVKAQGKKVTIKKNEGTSIAPGKKPEDAKKLLPAPKIYFPKIKQKLFNKDVNIKWEPVKSAFAYNVEISSNRSFTNILKKLNIKKNTNYKWKANKTGVYYLRISSIDSENFTGPFSKPIEFYIDVDVIPPFLLVENPKEGKSFFNTDIEVQGVTEKSALLTINGDIVKVKEDGKFSFPLKLKNGKQSIITIAKDIAGNTTEVKREVFCSLEDRLVYLDIPTNIRISTLEMTLTGHVKPLTTIEVEGKKIKLIENEFNHLLLLSEGANKITIKATSSQGIVQNIQLQIYVDKKPPVITIDEIPPFTKQSSVNITGNISEPGNVEINKKALKLKNTNFNYTSDLKEGTNTFLLTAKDEVENQSTEKIEILKDTKAPHIISHKFSSDKVKGGEIIKLIVKAQDQGVGLSRNGRFVVEIIPGNKELTGTLILTGEIGSYIGRIVIPPDLKGKIKLKKLHISDYLGNEAKYP